jgi:tetratricopeptide (TPR) repeat protein
MAKASTATVSAKNSSAPATNGAARSKPRILNGTTPAADTAARNKTLALYETAVKLMHNGKYEKAHAAFNEMLATASPEVANSIRTYIATCVSHVAKAAMKFESHEEQYDYAISLLNEGHYEDAREHFEQILTARGDADYAFYGLALLASMTDNAIDCIEHLREAIRLNPQNRFLARGDSDFQNVADDPRFTELLYPEA